MAAIYDVDEPHRDLAARVPEDIREALSPLELRLRCAEAHRIITEADGLSDQVKREREHSRAGRVLKAASPSSYGVTMKALEDELRAASLDGDTRRAVEIQEAIQRYDRRNPQPGRETLMAAANAAVSRLVIPRPLPSHQSAFSRRFGGKSRKGRR